MFDIGWSEMLIIGVVALIVVGPKDLPKMFHTLGQAMGKMRGLAREFQTAMSAAAKESGVGDLQRDMRNLTSGKSFRDAAGLGDLEKDIGLPGKPLHRPVAPGPGTDKLKSSKPAPVPADLPDDDMDFDDADDIAADYDADVAARNAKFSETEKLRLAKAARTAEARQEAARLRAMRDAEAQVETPDTPPTAPKAQD
jgi:sec-independent protein translocase protein TatB